MITSISSQAYVFLCTVISGALIAMFYDLFRIFRKAVRTSNFVTYAEDLLYWLIVTFIMLLTIYCSNDGELRAYLFIGAFIGVVLYALLLSRIVMASSLLIIRITTWPFKLAFRVLKPLTRKIAQLTAKLVRKVLSKKKAKTKKKGGFFRRTAN